MAPQAQETGMRPNFPLSLLLVWLSGSCLFLLPSSAVCQGLRGVILSAEDRFPINLALVELTDLETNRAMTLLTDGEGAFHADRLPGRANRLVVSAFGYLTHVDTIYAGSEEDSLVVEIRLGVDAIPVDPLVVVGSRRPVWESTEPEYLWEYFERKEFYGRLGMGSRFYDRAALDFRVGKIGSLSRLEALWPIQSYQGRFRGPDCETAVFVDGFEVRGQLEQRGPTVPGTFGPSAFSEVPWGIQNLVGVELYYGRGIPAEFQTATTLSRSVCRVIAIWTRRSVVPEEPKENEPRPGLFLPVLGLLAVLLIF